LGSSVPVHPSQENVDHLPHNFFVAVWQPLATEDQSDKAVVANDVPKASRRHGWIALHDALSDPTLDVFSHNVQPELPASLEEQIL
jgi:hypothetical protein